MGNPYDALPLGMRYSDQPEGEIRADQTPWQVRVGEQISNALFPHTGPANANLDTLAAVLSTLAGLNFGRMGINALSDVAGAQLFGRTPVQGALHTAEEGAFSRLPFLGSAESMANESATQAALRQSHNERLARQNISGLRWGMEPVPMQGPNAELAPSRSSLFPSIRGNPGNAKDVRMWNDVLDGNASPWFQVPRIDPPVDPTEWRALIDNANPYLRLP